MSVTLPPLLWIPGHMCGPWLYAPVLDAWPGEERVLDPLPGETVAEMAAALLAQVRGPVALAGLSMGGMVAMEAMAAAPDRIAGALLMATDPGSAPAKELAWRAAAVARFEAEGTAGYVDAFVGRFFRHDAVAEVRFGTETRARMGEVETARVAREARALDARAETTARLGRFAGPVEVVSGAQDRICPARLHPPISAACPAGALTEIPGAGHLLTLEAPEAVRGRVEVLAARIAGAGP